MDNKNSQDYRGGNDSSIDVTTQQPPVDATKLFSLNLKALLPLTKQLKHISLLKLIVLSIIAIIALILINGLKLEITTSSSGNINSTETYSLKIQPLASSINSVQNE